MKKILILTIVLFIISRFFINEKLVSIRGVGEYNEKDLISVKNTLKQYYNIDATINDDPITKSDYYMSNGKLDVHKILFYTFCNLFDNTVILVTSEQLTNSLQGVDFKGPSFMVLSSFKCKKFKTVIIHEFTHNIGLSHCDNDKCYMYDKLNNNVNSTMCDKCKKEIENKFDYK